MDTTFIVIWVAILLFDGVLMAWLTWAATSSRLSRYRIRTPAPGQHLDPWRKTVNTTLNNLMALLVFIAFLYFLGDDYLYAGWPGTLAFLAESFGVLLLYDFMYYFFHRAMHIRSVMRYCHALHHRVRAPLANESIYVHPLEGLGGLALLVVALVVVGPISAPSFLLMFFIYSTVNIIVHCNLVIPHPAFKLFNFWVEKHDVHHHKARNNYASIFPFWDMAFGTLE